MKLWKIKALYFGKITTPKGTSDGGLDPDIILDFPYTGFLLQNGEENVLVDNGIYDDFIVDGRAWGGYPAEGGERFVLEALEQEGLTPDDIDTVIYTHLHNDHAGNAHLFPNAATYYQKDEWDEMVNPLAPIRMGKVFDPRTPGELLKIKKTYMVDGDVELNNGLKLFKLPGHSKGSQAIVVPTAEGKYVIVGDIPHINVAIFPKLDKYQKLDGSWIDITPAPDHKMPFLIGSLVTDWYAAYDSYYKLMLLGEKFEPQWYLTGHDPWVIVKKNFG